MRTIQVSPKLTIASQPDLTDFAELAEHGFGLVINNRPDDEDFAQPGSAAEEQAAQAAGMAYAHVPVGPAPLTEADVRQFQAAMATADGPVLAHCKSGTRSLIVYAIGEVLDGRMAPSDLRPFGQQLGLDLRGAEAWLAQHRGE